MKEYKEGMMNINGNLGVREFIGMKPRIKEIRKSKGLMQNYCAEKANISQQLWSAYENGSKYPRIDRAYDIAKVLGVNIDELYEEKKEGEK